MIKVETLSMINLLSENVNSKVICQKSFCSKMIININNIG